MVKLQPYNQGEYICDAYVIIDEEKRPRIRPQR